METYTGTYQSEGREPHPVSIALLNNKIEISWLEDQLQKILYWPIDKLKIENNIVHYPGWPMQQLVPHQHAFIDQLKKQIKKDQHSFLHKLLGTQTMRLVKFVGVILVFLYLLFFVVVPAVAGNLAKRVSPAYEIQVGNDIYNQLTAGMNVNEAATETIMRFFQQLNIESVYPIEVTVVKGEILNAFALPGGHIIVYDEMLKEMDDVATLAALLAHEFMHIEKRHTTRSIFRQFSAAIVLYFIVGDMGSIGGVLLNRAEQLKNLSYSRSYEKEADLLGLQLIEKRGIGSHGFIDLFQLLKNSMRVSVSEWASSHPDIDRRIHYIRENAGRQTGKVEPGIRETFQQLKKEL
ncbi:MAG: M48 family metallopeptidase [Chitinophagaceae bacterium]|nr:M48 family metallopeptidase [Chitinophagaceae bacterium]